MKSSLIFHIGLWFFVLLSLSVLAQNEYTDLNEALKHTRQVKSIRLYSQTKYSESETLPAGLAECKKLNKIFIGWHKHLNLKKLFELLAKLPELDTLELYACDLQSLPKEVGLLTGLKYLNVELNKISYVAPEVGKLDKLLRLSLSSNQLTSLPLEVGTLKSLKILDLQSNQLTQLPGSICKLSNLSELHIWDNKIAELPENIYELANLRDFSIGENNIKELPKTFSKLRLEKLFISSNPFHQFPYEIFDIATLESLGLYKVAIDTLPNVITKLSIRELSMSGLQDMNWAQAFVRLSNVPSIEKISLDFNWRGELTEELIKLQQLQELELRGIKESYQSMEYVAKLVNLEKLTFENYSDTILPQEIGNLKQLRYIEFEHSKLTELPSAIGQLSELEELVITGNWWKSVIIPKEIGMLDQLKRIKCASCYIKALPDEIGNLTQLEELDLWGSDLEELPSSIGQMKKLEALYLSGNNIKKLPAEFFALSSLRIIDLHENDLQVMDEHINQLTNLESLDLSGNIQLITIPESFSQLQKLTSINLSNTQVSQLPASLLKLSSLKTLKICKTLVKNKVKYERLLGDKLEWDWNCDEVEQLVVNYKEKYGKDRTQLTIKDDSLILDYFYSYNEPNSVDEEYKERITIKALKSTLTPGKEIRIPHQSLDLSAVFSSIWRLKVDYVDLQGELKVIHVRNKSVKIFVQLNGKFNEDRDLEELLNKAIIYKTK